MINTIQDLIDALEAQKKISGNTFIRTQTQVGKIIELDYSIENFYSENKNYAIPVLIIKGYKVIE